MEKQIEKAKEAFEVAFNSFVKSENVFTYIKGESTEVDYIPSKEAIQAEKREFFEAFIL